MENLESLTFHFFPNLLSKWIENDKGLLVYTTIFLFQLRGGYPPSELGDDGSTLKEAGLLNTVLIHKSIR